MIDLNCHLLDGTLCGPESFGESLAMCQTAVGTGVHIIVATVQWKAGLAGPPLPFSQVAQKVARLQAEAPGRLSIKSGFAFEFSPALPALIKKYGTLITLGGQRHLLVSLPSTKLPAEAEQVWEALTEQGFSILLAHPDRSPALRRNPKLLSAWAARGLKFQLDAASVAGAYGREVKRFALWCLQQFHECTAVASNANSANRNALSAARAELVSRGGARLALRHMMEIPLTILTDTTPAANRAQRDVAKGLASLLRPLGPMMSFKSKA